MEKFKDGYIPQFFGGMRHRMAIARVVLMARTPDGSHDLVYKQPQSDDKEKLCKGAQQEGPVEAIGSDGEVPEGVHWGALA